jgi:hypothetical protein
LSIHGGFPFCGLNVNGDKKARELGGAFENGQASVGFCKAEKSNRVVTFGRD